MIDVSGNLRAELERVLEPHLRPPGPYAVLGFPRARNIGDYLIWLGTAEQLRRRGHQPVYTCDRTGYSREDLAPRLDGSGTILLAGGGNLGDLWPHEQRFRERVIEDFPTARIVQLPQSVHFGTAAALDRARATFARHPDLTLLLRDPASFDRARRNFGERTALCPDMAFGLPPIEVPPRRATGILWLARTDRESRHPPVEPLPRGVRRVDWAAGHGRPFVWSLGRQLARVLVGNGAVARPFGMRAAGHALATGAGTRLAWAQLARGVATLTSAEAVITDRLHAHILSVLVGRPQVVLDNRDGKVLAFVHQWTASSPLVHVASSAADALCRARALVAGDV